MGTQKSLICAIGVILVAQLLPAQTLNPVPGIYFYAFSPGSAQAGDAGFTLTVSGWGFIPFSVVRWNGSDRATTFASSSEVRVSISASDIAAGAQAQITVFNPPPGGGTSNTRIFTVYNPSPSITALTPSNAVLGGPSFTLSVFGSGFLSWSVVRWNESDRPTTFVSNTQLRASISASDIAVTGTAQVSVFHPPPGGGTATATFTIRNPTPVVASLSPSSAIAGASAFTLGVEGSGLVASSVVRWKRSNRPTTFVGSTQLRASIAAADIETAGTADVTVLNPAPGGGESSALTFTINNPVPAITSLSPSSAVARGNTFTLTVNGTGFVPSSQVRWNGYSGSRTTFVSTSQLRATVFGSEIFDVGTNVVTVFNPLPGGGLSNPFLFSVTTDRPTLNVAPEFLDFSAIQGASGPPPQTLSVSNLGTGALQWSADVKTNAGGDWLRISPAFGNAPSFILVTPNSTNLGSGVYTGLVAVRDTAGSAKMVPVTLVVSRSVPILQPTRTGFLFQGVEGRPSIPTQSLQVLNLGEGTMDWQARATTADAGNWLSVTPASGTSQAGRNADASPVTLRVNPAQLRAGVYVGLVTFESPQASNSPQVGIVLVNILPPGNDPLGVVQPAGLIFVGGAGPSAPAAQELILSGTGGQALQFVASARTASGGNWLTVTPSAGSVPVSGDAVTLRVQANTSGLSPGIYTGTVTVALGTGRGHDVAVALVVTSGASPSSLGAVNPGPPGNSATACTPTKMALVETVLTNNFTLSVGWPAAMRTHLVDDCGQPVTTATVIASFTNGDPVLALANLKDGRYAGTWAPAKETQTVGVTLRAAAPGLSEARVQFEGTIGTAAGPLAFRNGIVNAASFARFTPLAPGSIFSLFGRNLATARAEASGFPLPRELGEASVTLGGLPVPLFYADSGQVNGQVPLELAPGTMASLLVTRRGVAAPPDIVTVAPVQPGIFTVDQSGAGQGAILNAANELASPTRPARAGEIVQVFGTGLGSTTPAVASGEPAPSNPPATVNNPVTVTIGGLNAPVHFAGLAPGFVGLYQVNVQVPSGVRAGSAVPLVLTQAGVGSNTVTLAVQ